MAREPGSEKVACDIYPGEPSSLGRQRTAARHCVEGGPKQRFTRLSFVAGSRKTVRNGLGGRADFSYWQCYEAPDGPIAQLDRVTDFYSVGCRFESCWDRHMLKPVK
jgi:hypothetical protein